MLPTIIIVGADKGGVGKTTISRALLDYFRAHRDTRHVKPCVFDTEADPGVLRRFYPGAKLVDVAQVRGQMDVFDAVPDAKVTVVDLRAGVLSRVLGAMRDAGLLQDVHEGKMRMVVLHVLGSTEASLREIAATAEVLAIGGEHILVKNHATDGQFFEWDKATHDTYFNGAAVHGLIDIPHLDGMACDAVEQRGQSFAAFTADDKNSRMLRGVVKHWISQCWAQFDLAKIAER